MAKTPRVWGHPSVNRHWAPRRSVIIATLFFVAAGAAAHEPEAEFADWFRSLKELGTEGAISGQRFVLLSRFYVVIRRRELCPRARNPGPPA